MTIFFNETASEKAEQEVVEAVRFLCGADAVAVIKGALSTVEEAKKDYERSLYG